MLKLLVGLGNPGPQYAGTRHNAGFWWLDAVAHTLGARLEMERRFSALAARVSVEGRALWLLAPQTFMNLSGRAVGALAHFYKIAPEEILVAHDELDLPPGQARLKRGGGHAGHNGLRDIHAQLGSSEHWRLRFGIGHPGERAAVVGWVLHAPSEDERIAIEQAIDRSIAALPDLLAGRMERAMQGIHARPPREKAKKPDE